jgi:hypothetical protein
VRRLSHPLNEFAARVGKSRPTIRRWMNKKRLRYVQPNGPGTPREIPTSEYQRLGYVASLDEIE